MNIEHGQMENRDWTLDWTGLDWTGLFFLLCFCFFIKGGGGGVGMGGHFYFRFGIIAPRTEIVNF